MRNSSNLTDVTNYMLDTDIILHITTSEFQDFAFEGYGGDTITFKEIKLINLSTGEIKEIPWEYEPIKELYLNYKDKLHWKYEMPGFMTGSQLYGLYRPLIPYSELSARQQMNDDKRNSRYPNPDSKYINDITKAEIEQLLLDYQIGIAENINDARVYRDTAYTERSSYRREMAKIEDLKEILKNK